MKKTVDLRIEVYKLPEEGFKAFVADMGMEADDRGPEIYGNTAKQIRQRIGLRLAKLIVDEGAIATVDTDTE